VTMPFERTRALIETKQFLEQLLAPEDSPGVPDWAREQARKLLRHFPTYSNIEFAHRVLPHLYGPVSPDSLLADAGD